MKHEKVEVLSGLVLSKVEKIEDEELVFHTVDGQVFRMYHEQDCCEHVYIEDICGDLEDLVNSPIIIAEEISEQGDPLGEYDESYTWTFYKFATNKGFVTIRWYGSSNGYYSESVSFVQTN